MARKTTMSLDDKQLDRVNSYRKSLSAKLNKDMSNADVVMYLLDKEGWPG